MGLPRLELLSFNFIPNLNASSAKNHCLIEMMNVRLVGIGHPLLKVDIHFRKHRSGPFKEIVT